MRTRLVWLLIAATSVLWAAKNVWGGSIDAEPLKVELDNLTRDFDGRVGICVKDETAVVPSTAISDSRCKA